MIARSPIHSDRQLFGIFTNDRVVAAIRRVARLVPAPGRCRPARETTCDYTRPGKPDIAWDDKAAKAALITGLVLDALDQQAKC